MFEEEDVSLGSEKAGKRASCSHPMPFIPVNSDRGEACMRRDTRTPSLAWMTWETLKHKGSKYHGHHYILSGINVYTKHSGADIINSTFPN